MPVLFFHMADGEPFVGDVEDLPDPKDVYVLVEHPRQRDNKDLRNLLDGVNKILIPWHRINYIEVMPSDEDEEIFTIFRDD
jgi:hypothetical protein